MSRSTPTPASSPHALDLENSCRRLSHLDRQQGFQQRLDNLSQSGAPASASDWRTPWCCWLSPWIPAARISEVNGGFDKVIRKVQPCLHAGTRPRRDTFPRQQFPAAVRGVTREGLALHDRIVGLRASARNFSLDQRRGAADSHPPARKDPRASNRPGSGTHESSPAMEREARRRTRKVSKPSPDGPPGASGDLYRPLNGRSGCCRRSEHAKASCSTAACAAPACYARPAWRADHQGKAMRQRSVRRRTRRRRRCESTPVRAAWLGDGRAARIMTARSRTGLQGLFANRTVQVDRLIEGAPAPAAPQRPREGVVHAFEAACRSGRFVTTVEIAPPIPPIPAAARAPTVVRGTGRRRSTLPTDRRDRHMSSAAAAILAANGHTPVCQICLPRPQSHSGQGDILGAAARRS